MPLVRPTNAIAWELRTAWAQNLRVSLSLDERCQPRRLEGKLTRVAPTGAFAVIAGFHVPTDAILAVHRPSRLGDSTVDHPDVPELVCSACGARVSELYDGWSCEPCVRRHLKSRATASTKPRRPARRTTSRDSNTTHQQEPTP